MCPSSRLASPVSLGWSCRLGSLADHPSLRRRDVSSPSLPRRGKGGADPRHSCSVYRFDDLYPASAPKSASRSSHPLLPFRPRRKKEPRFSIPSFYWGDLEAADDSDSEEASSFYVRTSFGFGGKPDLKKAGIDQVYPKAIVGRSVFLALPLLIADLSPRSP